MDSKFIKGYTHFVSTLWVYYLQYFGNYEDRGIGKNLEKTYNILRTTKSSSGQPKSGARLSGVYHKDNLNFFLISSTAVLVLSQSFLYQRSLLFSLYLFIYLFIYFILFIYFFFGEDFRQGGMWLSAGVQRL